MSRPAAGLPLREALLLGATQGFAEFLPISSSAHLALLRRLLGVEHPRALDIALHLGSTGALAVVMRRDLSILIQRSRHRSSAWRQTEPFVSPGTLLLATVPAVVAGASLHGRLEGWEHHPARVAAALVVGSTALAVAALRAERDGARSSTRIETATALVAGVAQALALIPGISRSGATIAAATLAGLDRAAAARLSFLLAVPITLAANLRALRELRALARYTGLWPLLAGGGTAAITGLAGASLLRRWLTPRGLLAFAVYRCALAAALVLLPAARNSNAPPLRSAGFSPPGWGRAEARTTKRRDR